MPCTQIAMNAGVDAAVVTQKVLDSKGDVGYDAMKGEYVNMIEAGIIDPTKVRLLFFKLVEIYYINQDKLNFYSL